MFRSEITMESFTNTSIDTRQLPQFEAVTFQPLENDYKKVLFFNIAVLAFILIAIFGVFLIINPDLITGTVLLSAIFGIIVVIALTFLFGLLSLQKKGYAFRQHDVLFKSGIIATTITIIPYNRVQHVALHQGPVSRKLDLAMIEIFTAGGSGSDIRIAGIRKDEAEKIKQLVMAKLISETRIAISEPMEDATETPSNDAL